MNEKSCQINLYCKGLHFICFTVGLPFFYMTMLMNCEGPICRCGRVRHMWCQTANHAGEVFCTAHSSSQSDGAARRLSQSRVRVLWVLCFPQTWNNSRLNDMWLAYYSSTQQTPRLRFLLVTRESVFVLINFTPKEDRTVLFPSSVGCV